jgi:hypothetical protein
MSLDKIRIYNGQLRELINQRDFINHDLKKLIKILKVHIYLEYS